MSDSSDSTPSVSVIIATHNGARFLDRQLKSILEQTHLPSEILAGDDASSDKSMEILRHWQNRASQLGINFSIVRRERPLGVIGNFADLLASASGDIIFFADQDDIWMRNKVAEILRSFAEHPESLAVFSDAILIDSQGTPTGGTLWRTVDMSVERQERWQVDPLHEQLAGNRVTGATLAVRRRVRELALPMPDIGYHDGWIALLLAATGPGRIIPHPAPLIHYRLHDSNASGGLPPFGPFAPVWWYLKKGHIAESLDLVQLSPAINRLKTAGVSTGLLNEKLNFMQARRALPFGPYQRFRVVRARAWRPLYDRYTPGRLAMVLDVLWYDVRAGHIREPRLRFKQDE